MTGIDARSDLGKRKSRSRVTNGRALLPTVDARSVWGRLLRDTYQAMIAHCGGADYVSEPRRMASRRAAVLETELCFLEDKMARIRGEGGEPDPGLLDLYGRLAGQQKRQNEIVGFDRVAKDVTATVRAQLVEEARQRRAAAATDVEPA